MQILVRLAHHDDNKDTQTLGECAPPATCTMGYWDTKTRTGVRMRFINICGGMRGNVDER